MPFPTLLVPGNLRHGGRVITDERPIDTISRWIKNRMTIEFGAPPPRTLADRVLIVRSETASGKSTALPVFLFRILRSERSRISYRGPGVLCTQPRVLNARTLARDITSSGFYPDMVLGDTVGYQTGASNMLPQAGVLYATIGSALLARLKLGDFTSVAGRYRFIIVDEAHERDTETDSTIMLLKLALTRSLGSPNMPFVLFASATLDPKIFADYFGLPDDNVFVVTGRSEPIENFWPTESTADFLTACAETARRVHENGYGVESVGDILIFLPGQKEIDAVYDMLVEMNKALENPILPLKLTAPSVAKEDDDFYSVFAVMSTLTVEVDGKPRKPTRRVIMATSVAETGVTIPTVGHVIDCGWARSPEVFQPYDVRGILVTKPAARSRIEQRRGRAGRKFPGAFYPTYTEATYNLLEVDQFPAIIYKGPEPMLFELLESGAGEVEADSAMIASSVKQRGQFRVQKIDALEPPPAEAMAMILEKAVVLGYVSPSTYMLTWPGEVAKRVTGVTAEGIRLVLAGLVWGVSMRDLVTIATLVDPTIKFASAFDKRHWPADVWPAAREALGNWAAPRAFPAADFLDLRVEVADDFVDALLIHNAFVSAVVRSDLDADAVRSWCEEFWISHDKMVEFELRRDEVVDAFLVAGVDCMNLGGERSELSASKSREEFFERVRLIKMCVYESFRLNVLDFDAKRQTYVSRFGMSVKVKRFLASAHSPERIVTNRLDVLRKSFDKSLIYNINADMVCVLDGYVPSDPLMIAPKPSSDSP